MVFTKEGITSYILAFCIEETCNSWGNSWEARTGIFQYPLVTMFSMWININELSRDYYIPYIILLLKRFLLRYRTIVFKFPYLSDDLFWTLWTPKVKDWLQHIGLGDQTTVVHDKDEPDNGVIHVHNEDNGRKRSPSWGEQQISYKKVTFLRSHLAVAAETIGRR